MATKKARGEDDVLRTWAQASLTAFKDWMKRLQRGEASAGCPVDGGAWDYVVLTASDPSQAESYTMQIDSLVNHYRLPPRHITEYVVVPDPPTGKVGNGGSTFAVLDYLDKTYGQHKMSKARILLIHAGGYSQRLPNHSVCGKIFAPIPLPSESDTSTMFELKMAFSCLLPQHNRMNPGIFVTCADDIVLFNATTANFTREGFTALAHKSPLRVALTHGVFVLPEGSEDCLRFLHKPSEEKMRKNGALHTTPLPGDSQPWAWTDSAFYFSHSVGKRLLSFYRQDLGGVCRVEVDCYGDFLQPLGSEPSSEYIDDLSNVISEAGKTGSSLGDVRRQLFHTLKGTPLNAVLCDPSRFYHVGTISEVLNHFTGLNSDKFLHESGGVVNTDGVCSMFSASKGTSTAAKGSVMEYCVLEKGASVGSGCLLSTCIVPEGCSVPSDIFLQVWALREASGNGVEFVAHIFGTGDDLKTTNPSSQTLFGKCFSEVTKKLRFSPNQLWKGSVARNVWNASLYPIRRTPLEAVKAALLLHQVAVGTSSGIDPVGVRVSLGESLTKKDPPGQFRLRTELASEGITQQLAALVARRVDVRKWVVECPILMEILYPRPKDNEFAEKLIRHKVEQWCGFITNQVSAGSDLKLHKMRVERSLGYLLMTSTIPSIQDLGKTLIERGHVTLRDAMMEPFLPKSEGASASLHYLTPSDVALPVGKSATVKLPVRAIFAGGWTDTPPICLERGGAVLNMSIRFDEDAADELPVVVTCEVIDSPKVMLVSGDQGCEESVTTIQELLEYADTAGSALAIHKASTAFILCPWLTTALGLSSQLSLLPRELGSVLARALGPGKGIKLTTSVNIPKGSGLGTSSIIILACLRSMWKLFGVVYNKSTIFNDEMNAVMAVEQLMGTGGGWQDQVGGGIDGIKLTSHATALYPNYQLDMVEFDEPHRQYFDEHMVVLFTGKQRMAKSINTNVVESWNTRREGCVALLDDIHNNAIAMFQALQSYSDTSLEELKSDAEPFKLVGELLDLDMLQFRALEHTIFNPYISGLRHALTDYLTGSKLMGSGAGGFIVGFLRRGRTREQLLDFLESEFPLAKMMKCRVVY